MSFSYSLISDVFVGDCAVVSFCSLSCLPARVLCCISPIFILCCLIESSRSVIRANKSPLPFCETAVPGNDGFFSPCELGTYVSLLKWIELSSWLLALS